MGKQHCDCRVKKPNEINAASGGAFGEDFPPISPTARLQKSWTSPQVLVLFLSAWEGRFDHREGSAALFAYGDSGMADKVILTVELPKDLAEAARLAADRGLMSRPAWIRRAMLEAARAAGVLPVDGAAA